MIEANGSAVRRPLVRRLLRAFRGRAATPAALARRAAERGLPAGWAEREFAGYVNDATTAVFEAPQAELSGVGGLAFGQEVWMLRPTAFEYVALGEVVVVRLRWNRKAAAGLG